VEAANRRRAASSALAHHDRVQVRCSRRDRALDVWFPKGWETLSDPERTRVLDEKKAEWLKAQTRKSEAVEIRDGFYFAHDGHVLLCHVSAPLQGKGGWVVEVDLNGHQESIGPQSANDTRRSVERMAVAWYDRKYKQRGGE
jgi:hypothetical protein